MASQIILYSTSYVYVQVPTNVDVHCVPKEEANSGATQVHSVKFAKGSQGDSKKEVGAAEGSVKLCSHQWSGQLFAKTHPHDIFLRKKNEFPFLKSFFSPIALLPKPALTP